MAETARGRGSRDRGPFLAAFVATAACACVGLVLHSALVALTAVALGGAVAAAYVPVSALLRTRAIATIERLDEPSSVEAYLASASEPVREAAGHRLAALLPGERSRDLLLSLANDPRREGGAVALAHALARSVAKDAVIASLLALLPAAEEARAARIARVAGELAPPPALVETALADSRGSVRLALAKGIASTDAGARALVHLAAEPSLPSSLRGEALDELERCPRPAVLAASRVALAREEPTAEVLWALALGGEPDDAALAARFVAAPTFPVASSACDVATELLARGVPSNAAALRDALARGREALRREHEPGDNLLADDLVERIVSLEGRLGELPSGVPS